MSPPFSGGTPTPTPTSPAAARKPPTTTFVDLLRLVGAIVGNGVRHPTQFSVRSAFRGWVRQAADRHGSANLILNFGVKKVLLVGAVDLSEGILAMRPSREGITTGELKRKGMSFLAPHALTISDGSQWEQLRVFNEGVLEPGRPHKLESDFLRCVNDAFAAPIRDMHGIRAAMARSMLGIVFGGAAPPGIADDVEKLFAIVQSPLKRLLFGWMASSRRTRVYDALRKLWRDPAAVRTASLLGMAHQTAAAAPTAIDETLLLEQFPHWMFTFTGSGTDLVARTLALILSDPEARQRVEREISDASPTTDADAAAIEQLAFLEACLLESARLFPPVTRTFHTAPHGASVRGVAIPAAMEVLHSFPLIANGDDENAARNFRPERWLPGSGAMPTFDPFLGGARRCPGRNIIMFVNKAALAIMLTRRRLMLDGAALPTHALPLEFPRRSAKFRPA